MRINRLLVRERYLASARPSRRIYPAPVEARLKPLREGIVVFQLEGALFFGSSDWLIEEADTLAAECRCLVLDLRRVSAIDESGEMAVQQMVARLKARGVPVEPAVVYALTLDALDEIGRSHPAAAIRLHRNVALHLSQRLRGAASAWRDSAQ